MKHYFSRCLSAVGFVVLCSLLANAEPKVGDDAPDFPIGKFSDGKSYLLSELRGKVVVLFFYEHDCPSCRASIPARNEIVKAYDDKPVKFLAVGASDPLPLTHLYTRETRIKMPIFADNLGLMETRYGQQLSLKNIWQFRVIGPDGKIVGYEMDKKTIDKALEKATWKYNPKDYDPKLKPALDEFECNHLETGLKLLNPLRRNSTKSLADSAGKLYNILKSEAEAWKSEADKIAETEPVKAHDLYTKVAANFLAEPFAKEATSAKQKLATNKAVVAEANARKAYTQTLANIGAANPNQKAELAAYLQVFTVRHDGTPTAEKVAVLVKELSGK